MGSSRSTWWTISPSPPPTLVSKHNWQYTLARVASNLGSVPRDKQHRWFCQIPDRHLCKFAHIPCTVSTSATLLRCIRRRTRRFFFTLTFLIPFSRRGIILCIAVTLSPQFWGESSISRLDRVHAMCTSSSCKIFSRNYDTIFSLFFLTFFFRDVSKTHRDISPSRVSYIDEISIVTMRYETIT